MLTHICLQIYRFLTAEAHAYLSSFETMTIFHLRDLASGKRKIVRAASVKVFQVPQYEGLTIHDMLTFASDYPEVQSSLPLEQREVEKLPREYIANICHTLIG